MKLPTNLMIIDCMPKGKWLTAMEVKTMIEKKYGKVYISVIAGTLHKMTDAVTMKMLKRGCPRKLEYRLVSVPDDYLIRNVRDIQDKSVLPEWMRKFAEPKKTYPAGFLMAEFNKLIREVRHA